MKNKSFRLIILIVGLSINAVFFAWYFLQNSDPIDEISVQAPDCYPKLVESYDVSNYSGILTRPIYLVNLNNDQKDSILSENASTKATADLFSRFQEIPLKQLPNCVEEIYRLTWIPTFHAPAIINIWTSDSNYFITIKRLNGKGGYDLGYLEFEQTNSLTVKKWQQIQNSIENGKFWEKPSFTVEPMLHDGAGWLLEGKHKSRYHHIYRRIPTKDLAAIFNDFFAETDIETEHKLYLK